MANNIQLQHKGQIFKGCFKHLKTEFEQVFKYLNSMRGYYTFN